MMHIISSANAQDYYRQGKQFLEAAWRCYGKEDMDVFNIIENGKIQNIVSNGAVVPDKIY